MRAEVEVDEELDAEEQEKLKGTKEEMKKVFDRIDENGNGSVCKPFEFTATCCTQSNHFASLMTQISGR